MHRGEKGANAARAPPPSKIKDPPGPPRGSRSAVPAHNFFNVVSACSYALSKAKYLVSRNLHCLRSFSRVATSRANGLSRFRLSLSWLGSSPKSHDPPQSPQLSSISSTRSGIQPRVLVDSFDSTKSPSMSASLSIVQRHHTRACNRT